MVLVASSDIFTVEVPVELSSRVTPGMTSVIVFVGRVRVPIPEIVTEEFAAAFSE